jgi:hypothetical protein
MKSDAAILDAILASGALSEENAKIFSRMLDDLTRNRRTRSRLSPKQRAWVESIYEQLQLEELEPLNLVSSGAYVPTEEELTKKHPYQLMPRPLKPPGK